MLSVLQVLHEVLGMAERFMLLKVIGMAARAGMIFAALSLAKTSPTDGLMDVLVCMQLRCS